MILTRELLIKINESNFIYYEELGYDVALGESLLIPIELLSTGSHQKISCECDGCGSIKEVIYKNYIKYDNNWGEYFCRKCSEVKRKRSLQNKWGVDYPIQNPEIRNRIQDKLKQKTKKLS